MKEVIGRNLEVGLPPREGKGERYKNRRTQKAGKLAVAQEVHKIAGLPAVEMWRWKGKLCLA